MDQRSSKSVDWNEDWDYFGIGTGQKGHTFLQSGQTRVDLSCPWNTRTITDWFRCKYFNHVSSAISCMEAHQRYTFMHKCSHIYTCITLVPSCTLKHAR